MLYITGLCFLCLKICLFSSSYFVTVNQWESLPCLAEVTENNNRCASVNSQSNCLYIFDICAWERDNRGKQKVWFSFLYVHPHWKLAEKTQTVQLTNRSSCALHTKCCQIGNYYYMHGQVKMALGYFLFHLASFPQENFRFILADSLEYNLLLRLTGFNRLNTQWLIWPTKPNNI